MKILPNQWSWSKLANVVYLEAPCGVGFSYSPNDEDLVSGDNQTATDSLAALQELFDLFPEYKKNPFYVSGESYGGVYVPTLSLKIYQSGALPQMAGFLVGNGVFDWGDNAETHVPFAYGHGFVTSYECTTASCRCGSCSVGSGLPLPLPLGLYEALEHRLEVCVNADAHLGPVCVADYRKLGVLVTKSL